MRTSALQDLYLQRPVTLMVLICMISVLPWIGLDAYTSDEELKEITIASSILESGDFVWRGSYSDQAAYVSPMPYWLMAAFSYPQGYVSAFTSRLPSALAFFVLIGCILAFFGKRIEKFQEAFITTCLLATSIGIHLAAMTAGTYMVAAMFIVLGLIQLYRWEEFLELKGLPVMIPILLGCTVLTTGPMGLILPLVTFGIYLFTLGKYHWRTVLKALLYIGVSSLFIPLLWYIAVWQNNGSEFLSAMAPNHCSEFFSLKAGEKVWHRLVQLVINLLPWTLILVFSLFGLEKGQSGSTSKVSLKDTWTKIRGMEKVRLFSLVIAVCFLIFYLIPYDKGNVYLIPAYSFVMLFVSQYILYLAEYKTIVTRFYAAFMTAVVTLLLIGVFLTMGNVIDPATIVSRYTENTDILAITSSISQTFTSPDFLTILKISALTVSLIILIYQIYRKINIKILYAVIGLTFCVYLLIDGISL